MDVAIEKFLKVFASVVAQNDVDALIVVHDFEKFGCVFIFF